MSRAFSGVNLLPPAVAYHRARRARLRVLTLVGAGYVGLLVAASAVGLLVTAPSDDSPASELARLERGSAELSEAASRVTAKLRVARARLEARRTLAEQPDFSLLLGLLGSCMDGEAVVRQMQLRSVGVDASRPDAVEARPGAGASHATPPVGAEREPKYFTLLLRGSAVAESAMTRFTKRVEALSLFDAVEIKRTGRETAAGSTAISFELECRFTTTAPQVQPRQVTAGLGSTEGTP